MTKKAITQKDIRQGVEVGTSLMAVTAVADWYRAGHFESDEQAKGAFELAYQQGMDGMGKSVQHWMGLNEAEYDAWIKERALPKRKK